jgi:hypothetical protein
MRVEGFRFFTISPPDDLLPGQHCRVGPAVFQQNQFHGLFPLLQRPPEFTFLVAACNQPQQATGQERSDIS